MKAASKYKKKCQNATLSSETAVVQARGRAAARWAYRLGSPSRVHSLTSRSPLPTIAREPPEPYSQPRRATLLIFRLPTLKI
uniref:Uncharacterized protein n=1 Tax=Heliothis virescens TaxID=7102 RepID=A0A2A4IWU3_HELVI